MEKILSDLKAMRLPGMARMAKTEHSHPLERFNPFTIEP